MTKIDKSAFTDISNPSVSSRDYGADIHKKSIWSNQYDSFDAQLIQQIGEDFALEFDSSPNFSKKSSALERIFCIILPVIAFWYVIWLTIRNIA